MSEKNIARSQNRIIHVAWREFASIRVLAIDLVCNLLAQIIKIVFGVNIP